MVGKLYHADGLRDWLRLPPSREHEAGTTSDDLRASLAAVIIISAPFTMIKASIGALLLGLGFYQGYTWALELDTSAGTGDSQNVFITLMVTTGVCILFFLVAFSAKVIENVLRAAAGNPGSVLRVMADAHSPEVQNPNQVPTRRRAHGALAEALENAARAHTHSAEADHQVALELSRAHDAQQENMDIDGDTSV